MKRLTLVTLLHYDCVQLAKHFKVLDDVRILVGNQYEEQLFHWHVYISDCVSFDMSALLAYNHIQLE